LATQYGAHAVRLIMEGKLGEMVCYHPPEIESVPIIEAVNKIRQVNPDGSTVQAARGLGVCFGDRASDQNPFGVRAEPRSESGNLGEDEPAVTAAEIEINATAFDVVPVATATDVELDADFVLDLAEAAAEEAISD
jgi:hypothetical protein